MQTKEINSLGLDKLVCYIRYFVKSDLFISSFHCSSFGQLDGHSSQPQNCWGKLPKIQRSEENGGKGPG